MFRSFLQQRFLCPQAGLSQERVAAPCPFASSFRLSTGWFQRSKDRLEILTGQGLEIVTAPALARTAIVLPALARVAAVAVGAGVVAIWTSGSEDAGCGSTRGRHGRQPWTIHVSGRGNGRCVEEQDPSPSKRSGFGVSWHSPAPECYETSCQPSPLALAPHLRTEAAS